MLSAACMAVAGGCGYSSAREYQRIHSIVVPAQPGDGAVVMAVGGWDTERGLARAVAAADQGRDRATDSATVGD